MTDRELMQLVAGKSPAVRKRALDALRAIAVDSPAVHLRVGRVAEIALTDPEVEWSPEERSQLIDAVTAGHGFVPKDDSTINALSLLLTDSGLSQAELGAVLGRDERTVGRWLSGQFAIPGSVADQIARLRISEVTRDTVWLAYRR